MSNLSNDTRLTATGMSRRRVLGFGASIIGGLSLADVMRLRAEASSAAAASDTAVILVWLSGGASHLDTYDMKPDTPSEIRGEFKPISTCVPGIDVCELLPLHAQLAHRFSLIRSIQHEWADHATGHRRFLTGRNLRNPFGWLNDSPPGPSIVAKMREDVRRGIPNYISITDVGREKPDDFAFGASYLGPSYTPFALSGDPGDGKFEVRNLSITAEAQQRLRNRVELLKSIDRFKRSLDQSGTMHAMDRFNQEALEIVTSDRARKAFDISLENPKVRERYGNHPWGHRNLLARRLVEAGSSFVTVVFEDPTKPGQAMPAGVLGNWDSHAVNGHIFADSRFRLPFYDQAVTALIEDIYERGLDKKVMVIVAGEFGRTPKIYNAIGTITGVMQPGREHWPGAQTVLVAGGGLRMGQVVGSTSAKGEAPKDRPLTPNDLWATIYRHLGIDYNHAFLDHTGRPMPILATGEPIRELI